MSDAQNIRINQPVLRCSNCNDPLDARKSFLKNDEALCFWCVKQKGFSSKRRFEKDDE